MKKTLILAMMLTLTTLAWAQRGQRGQRPEPPSVEERIEKAQEELSLTDAQVTEWKAIFEKYDESLAEARQNRDRELGEQTRTAMETALKATLTEDQQEKFDKMQKNRQRRGGRN